MTYEKKYTKYKQKYLNLISKINVLKGGAGERGAGESIRDGVFDVLFFFQILFVFDIIRVFGVFEILGIHESFLKNRCTA